ncbi:MAG: hypothetical protein BECKG1743E_GA0114224_109773, partial [Candidatus Kentron sp. G]
MAHHEFIGEVVVFVDEQIQEVAGFAYGGKQVLRPSKFEGHRPTIRHGCRMALMVALNWSVECVKEES